MTDQKIIEHLLQNKYSQAVKGLYDILPAARKYIVNNSGTADDAEDVFQDALVILCKKVRDGELQLTVPLKHYVMGIVKNCWMQQLRQNKKILINEITTDIPAVERNEESSFFLAKAAFELLGEKCRQLLILFYHRQESFKHIAAKLAFSDEKVAKNQKYRCLQKAKDHYLTLSNNNTHD